MTGWWFSPGTPVSSTNKTDRHCKAEILLQVTLKHHKQIKDTNIKKYIKNAYRQSAKQKILQSTTL